MEMDISPMNTNDASVNIGASEICDGVDNNCNGDIDEGVFGNALLSTESCSQPSNYVLKNTVHMRGFQHEGEDRSYLYCLTIWVR